MQQRVQPGLVTVAGGVDRADDVAAARRQAGRVRVAVGRIVELVVHEHVEQQHTVGGRTLSDHRRQIRCRIEAAGRRHGARRAQDTGLGAQPGQVERVRRGEMMRHHRVEMRPPTPSTTINERLDATRSANVLPGRDAPAPRPALTLLQLRPPDTT